MLTGVQFNKPAPRRTAHLPAQHPPSGNSRFVSSLRQTFLKGNAAVTDKPQVPCRPPTSDAAPQTLRWLGTSSRSITVTAIATWAMTFSRNQPFDTSIAGYRSLSQAKRMKPAPRL